MALSHQDSHAVTTLMSANRRGRCPRSVDHQPSTTMTTLHRLEALVLLPLALLHALAARLFPRAQPGHISPGRGREGGPHCGYPWPAPTTAVLLVQAQAASPAPAAVAPPALASLTVPQLRTLARTRLGSSTRLEGRRIAQARRSALLEALAA